MMNNRESLDEFLSQFNRKQQAARVFTFAMSALGLFVIVGLVGLTVWGFASYNSARSTLSNTSQQLEVSQKKIGELETIVSSNSAGAEVVRLQQKLSETEKNVAAKEARIIELETLVQDNGAMKASNSNQSTLAPDCTECQSKVDEQVKRINELNEQNLNLRKRLDNCKCGPGKAGATRPGTDKRTDILN
jgi:hypothetical protein